MNERAALRMLSRVMAWDLEKAQQEFEWLRLISAVKYDSYRDFLAGVRFLESLVGWLLQFQSVDRAAAYDFVRHRLVFISAVERERLVEAMYPRIVLPWLLRSVAQARGIAPWQIYTAPDAMRDLEVARRRTLFLGLSDGARLDTFRHANVGRISNEQVVMGSQLDTEKWEDLRAELEKDLRSLGFMGEATFDTIYLVDDFAGSGSTFTRFDIKEDKRKWSGKLRRFLRSLSQCEVPVQTATWRLVVHHLILTQKAHEKLKAEMAELMSDVPETLPWFTSFEVTYSYLLDTEVSLDETRDAEFYRLTQEYYDAGVQTKHTNHHLGMGYKQCALPLVLDHNTPNNSVALLWAESKADTGEHPMQPLFYRRQRHS